MSGARTRTGTNASVAPTTWDAKVNGARRHAVKLGDSTPKLCDTDSNSDSNSDSADDTVFEEVFVQLGLDGKLEDYDGVIGQDPEHGNVEQLLGYCVRAAMVEARNDIDVNPDLPLAIVMEVWKMLRAHD